MSRNHKARARARRAAARNAASRPLLNGSHSRRLHGEQLEPRRVLAPILVTTPLDVVDFADNVTSLREAIFAANTVPGPDEIQFAPSLFTAGPVTILLTGGSLRVSESLTVTGPSADVLAIDASGSDPTPDVDNGDGTSAFTVLLSVGGAISISGLTIRGGDVAGGGAAIYSEMPLTLSNVNVTDNATTFSGAVFADVLTISHSRVTGNRAIGISAIYARQQLTMTDVEVSKNRSTQRQAAVWVGGRVPGNPTALIERSRIFENEGVGIRFDLNSDGAIRDSTVSGNSGRDAGGVAFMGRTLLIEQSTISDNYAQREGGGIYARRGLTISQSTISGNTSRLSGGGIAASGLIVVRHSTITDNTASAGGGIATTLRSTPIQLDHVIVAGNHALSPENGPDLSMTSGQASDFRYSIIGSNGGLRSWSLPEAPLNAPDANGNLIGGPIHGVIDPLLAPLADNGGPTLTHALLPGSLAIDAGDPALRPGVGDTPQFDQRGEPFSRVVGARIDIGAVEQTGVSFIVDTLVDESDNDYRRGDLSLREAIELANAQPGAGVITFDPALFSAGPATILLTGGELTISDSLTLTGPGADLLTIDAQRLSRILFIGADCLDAWVLGLTLTRGRTRDAELTGRPDFGGGAIRSLSPGIVTVSECVFSANLTSAQDASGGAIYSEEGKLVLTRSVFNDNFTNIVRSRGGAVFVASGALDVSDCLFARNATYWGDSDGGAIYSAGTASIIRTHFEANFAADSPGGAATFVTDVSITDSMFVNNRADNDGGAIAIQDGTLTVSGAVFTDNGTKLFSGGAISVRWGAANIDSSLFQHNTAGSNGGGIFGLSADVSATNSTFHLNEAGVGGGVFLRGGNLEINNTTVSSNVARRQGGGLYYDETRSGRHAVVSHSTIARNSAGLDSNADGGGLFVADGFATLSHLLIAGNENGDIAGAGSITAEFTMIGDATRSQFAEAPLGAPDANGNLIGGPIHGVIDPLLAPLADNGGPTLTHALLPGSPALNAGDPAFTPGQGGAPEFDQRGAPFTRVAGGRIDIGAFELQSPNGALQADFDTDGDADGNDFLQWQRNLGKTTGATVRHGDATADGDVDAHDLAVWRARFSARGAVASEAPSAARPAYSPPARTHSILGSQTSILPPVQPPTASQRRSALPEQAHERLTPPRRVEFTPRSPAVFDAAHQVPSDHAPTRPQDLEHERGDFAAALDAALQQLAL